MKIRALLWKICRLDSKVVSTKENFVLLMVVFISWFVCVTVLVPLLFVLTMSSSLRHLLYKWNMQYKSKGVDVLTKKLFCLLRDSCPQFDFRKLRILELGHKSSFNFDEYSEQHEIDVACDNIEVGDKLVEMSKTIRICTEKDVLEDCRDNAYDVVVSTFYLCSVKNPKKAVESIRRILKPVSIFCFFKDGMSVIVGEK